MGTESANPLDELKSLDARVDQIQDLEALKPIFFRLDEIGRQHSGDFEVQLAVTEIKQHVVDRGKLLKQQAAQPTPAAPAPIPAPPPAAGAPAIPPSAPPPIASKADAPTVILPPQGAPQPPRAAQPPPPAPAKRVEDAPTVILPPTPPPARRVEDAPTVILPPQKPAATPRVEDAPTVRMQRPADLPPAAPPQTPPVGAPLATTGPRPAVPAAFQPPPEAPPQTVQGAPPVAPPPQQPPQGGSWKKSLGVGAIVGALIALGLIVFLVNQARKKNATISVQMVTTPPGAAIRINGETKCNANCSVDLPPGAYQVVAVLEGYEPAASNLTVTAGQPASVNLALEPQSQVVRVLTDLDQGKITLDDQPPADLQDGQFIFDKVSPGTHTIKVTSRTGEATFAVAINDAKRPEIAGPVTARNLLAVMVASMGNAARVVTNSGPLKLAMNGQTQADVSPAGVDLANYQPGVVELAIGEGKDQKSVKESFSPAPTLTAFLKSDLNIGTLIVSAGEDDVRVFLNNKEYPRRTQRGQLRIPTIGIVNVRVEKNGYEPVATQTAEIRKGFETRVEFKLQALPQMATLQIRGATPGAEVVLDQRPLGTVGDDGSFTNAAIAPGEHTVEIRKDQYLPRRFQRPFRAGQAVALAGSDVVLSAAIGSVRVTKSPAEATVFYRRADDQQNQEARGNTLELPPGTYVFTARASGYTEKTERVQVAAGETHNVELALARVVQAAAPPAPKAGGILDFDDPNLWKQDNGMFTHRGAGFLSYKLPAKGTFAFTVQLLRGGNIFRGGKIRWATQYQDARNYDLFELDQRYLWSKVIIAGKTYERGKYDHNLTDKDKSYSIQIDVSADKLVHRVKNGNEWVVVDSWSEPGRNFTEGKFGFLIQGNDEIGVSDFKFTPR